MARARPNKDTNSGDRAALLGLSADADAVLGHAGLHRSIKLQRRGDLTTLQVTEVLAGRLTRELQVAILLLQGLILLLGHLDLITAIDLIGKCALLRLMRRRFLCHIKAAQVE